MFLKKILTLTVLLSVSFLESTATNEYVVISGKDVKGDKLWSDVVNAIEKKHKASVVYYEDSVQQVLPELRKLSPRYVAIVEKPENIGRDYIISIHKLARNVDNDFYEDFLWGIITGYTPQAAMKMVKESTEPLVIKDAVSTISETSSGKWFDRLGYLRDSKPYIWGEKKSATSPVEEFTIIGKDKNELKVGEMKKFAELYSIYNPDLIITASHATEMNLEMPFSLGNVLSKEGKLFMDIPGNPQYLEHSGKRKVYLPIGNCLIGNVKNTKNSMAIAWMNDANVAAMMGYVVTTWHGRAGWGTLKYIFTNPGRHTLFESAFLNQQDLLYHLNSWNTELTSVKYPSFGKDEWNKGGELMSSLVENPKTEMLGYLHDRDVLAIYGDPKWDVRVKNLKDENDYSVNSYIKNHKCIITIKTDSNFSLDRMKGDKFKMESCPDLPFSYIFPKKLKNPRLADGQTWKAAFDENFILIYDADFKANSEYTITLNID